MIIGSDSNPPGGTPESLTGFEPGLLIYELHFIDRLLEIMLNLSFHDIPFTYSPDNEAHPILHHKADRLAVIITTVKDDR
jgi:hypothetical protein